MKLLKSKQPKQEASSEASDLATRIKNVCAEAEAYIDGKVLALKASPEGESLPVLWLDQDLRRRNGGNCSCRVALKLLESDNG